MRTPKAHPRASQFQGLDDAEPLSQRKIGGLELGVVYMYSLSWFHGREASRMWVQDSGLAVFCFVIRAGLFRDGCSLPDSSQSHRESEFLCGILPCVGIEERTWLVVQSNITYASRYTGSESFLLIAGANEAEATLLRNCQTSLSTMSIVVLVFYPGHPCHQIMLTFESAPKTTTLRMS